MIWRILIIALSLVGFWQAYEQLKFSSLTVNRVDLDVAQVEFDGLEGAHYVSIKNAVADQQKILLHGKGILYPISSITRRNDAILASRKRASNIYVSVPHLQPACKKYNHFCISEAPKTYTGLTIEKLENLPKDVQLLMSRNFDAIPADIVLLYQGKNPPSGVNGLVIAVVSLIAFLLTGYSLLLKLRPETESDSTQLQITKDYHDVTRRAMCLMAIADGRADDIEIELIIKIFKQETGIELDKKEIMEEMNVLRQQHLDVTMYLRQVSYRLSREVKEMIVSSVIKVMAADNELTEGERALLADIGAALQLPQTQISHLFHDVLSDKDETTD